MSEDLRRVQFVVSGPFLLLLLLAAGFMTAGFWLYIHPPPPPAAPPGPPYYVNRTSTAIRPCFQCVGADGKLKQPQEWKFGKVVDIPQGELWWFAAVEDRSTPAKIEGVPVLAVHPAADNEKPWDGFDQRRIFLVVFQDLDGKFALEHPAPPPPAPAPTSPPPESTPPTDAPVTSTATQQP